MFKPPESATLLVLLPFLAALAACTPSPQEDAMRSPSPVSGTIVQGSSEARLDAQVVGATNPTKRGAGDQARAALGPTPESVSAAENLAPTGPADSPAEAQGRRTLSTAFVRVGPDGHLTVELRNGRVLVLRNVVMRPKNYCGVQVLGGPTGAQYCGGYAGIAAARPGGAPIPEESDLAVSNAVESPRSPSERN